MIDQENINFLFALQFNSDLNEKNNKKNTTDIDFKMCYLNVNNLLCQIWLKHKGKNVKRPVNVNTNSISVSLGMGFKSLNLLLPIKFIL